MFSCGLKSIVSVTGLSIDFVLISLFGFICYSISTCCFYFSESVREEYRKLHGGMDNLVDLNDVIFAVHATILTLVYCIQIVIYRKPDERPSLFGIILSALLMILVFGGAATVAFNGILILDYLYWLFYAKITLTVIKYIPQAWMNYMRKSTSGWSITNVLLDFTGGFLSMTQLLLDAIATGHLAGIIGFLPKLALGVISVVFDTLFMLQHYLWYSEETEVQRLNLKKSRQLKPDGKSESVSSVMSAEGSKKLSDATSYD